MKLVILPSTAAPVMLVFIKSGNLLFCWWWVFWMPSVLLIPSIAVMVHSLRVVPTVKNLSYHLIAQKLYPTGGPLTQHTEEQSMEKGNIKFCPVLSHPPFEDITVMPALQHQSDTSEQYNAALDYLTAK